MRRRLPPLKTLPAFEIAAERLSFTDAAGELHLTHGAVSRQIQALESHLGVPLFRRRNRRIELTEAGVAFLPGVRQALHLLETSTAEVATSPRQGALVVSCVATFMMRWLIPRLYAFNALHRKIEVRLSASTRRSISPATASISRSGSAGRHGRAMWWPRRFSPTASGRSAHRRCSTAAKPCASSNCAATGCCTPRPARNLGRTGRERAAPQSTPARAKVLSITISCWKRPRAGSASASPLFRWWRMT